MPKPPRTKDHWELKRRIKKWEKWVMIIEYVIDKHCIRNPDDKEMKSARAYLHNLRTQIRLETGYAQSALPTILDFYSRKVPQDSWQGYLKRLKHPGRKTEEAPA